MNLMTLESIAEKEFEERADKWVQAIAKREGVGFDELRPHLVSLYHSSSRLAAVFIIPGHTAIKLHSEWYPRSEGRIAKLEDNNLVGDYVWSVARTFYTGSSSFSGAKNLGYALLLARWAHDEDEKAKWA